MAKKGMFRNSGGGTTDRVGYGQPSGGGGDKKFSSHQLTTRKHSGRKGKRK